jgi:hypothetical protein
VREWKSDDVPAGQSSHWKDKLDYRHVANFADAIRAGDPSIARSSVVDSVRSTHVTILANISQRTGETIHVDPETGALLGTTGREFWGRAYEPGWEWRG